MKKKPERTQTDRANGDRPFPRVAQLSRDIVRAWQPLFGRLLETIDWALDIASRLSTNYHEDHEAIEQVRTFVHDWLAGRPAEIPLNELLTTIAILFSTIELDLGIEEVCETESREVRVPPMIRCPGVDPLDHSRVLRRRRPVRVYASTEAIRLAA